MRRSLLREVSIPYMMGREKKKSNTIKHWWSELLSSSWTLQQRLEHLVVLFQGEKKQRRWMKQHGNSFLRSILRQEIWLLRWLLKSFHRSTVALGGAPKLSAFFVLFRNYRLIIGRLRFAHCLPRLLCSHRKAWDNIYPDRLHVGAEGWRPTSHCWLEAHESEVEGCCPLGGGDRWGTTYSLTEQLILNVEVKAEVEFKEQPEGA